MGSVADLRARSRAHDATVLLDDHEALFGESPEELG
jgi:hypothetical protein